jgi:hypothetical protein
LSEPGPLTFDQPVLCSEIARLELRRLSIAVKNVINLWRLEEGNSGFSLYDFSQMKGATNGFSIENKLGQGGFGAVYKVFTILVIFSDVQTFTLSPCSVHILFLAQCMYTYTCLVLSGSAA